MLWICQEEDMCPYSLNAWWGGKIPRIPDGELQRLVEFWGQKRKKRNLHLYMLFGFQEKSSSLIQKHTPAYSVVRKLFFFYPIRFCTRKSNFVWKCVNIFFMKIISKQIIFFFSWFGDEIWPKLFFEKFHEN